MKVITIARKPLSGSVADTCLKYGTGGLNIDGCRIPINGEKTQRLNKGVEWGYRKPEYYVDRSNELFGSPLGRFPANLILQHLPECQEENCAEGCPVGSPVGSLNALGVTSSGATKREISSYEGDSNTGFLRGDSNPRNQHGDSGSVARFFKQVKG